MVMPERVAVTPESTRKTRLAFPPLTVTPPAGLVIVAVPLVSLSLSWPLISVIVCGPEKTVASKATVLAPEVEFA
jgi:hypothetical protein